MAAEDVILQGKVKWAKVHQPNMFNKWSLDLYMNPESIEKFKAMEVKNVLKKDEDGYYATFSRATIRKVRGRDVALSPPTVLDKDNIPTIAAIGNGSDVTVKLQRYSYQVPQQPGKREYACRIEGIRIDNLVTYTDASRTDEQIKDVKALRDAPRPF